MYSRRFSNSAVEPPPDYGGSVYRREKRSPEEAPTPPYESGEDAPRTNGEERGAPRETAEESARREPRRALYSDDRTARPAGGAKGQGGLFTLGSRSFSLEDVILAGMILLLLGDRGENGKPDTELLLILGLLLGR